MSVQTDKKLTRKNVEANEGNIVEFVVLPNDTFHTIMPFVFKCSSFEFQIVLQFYDWSVKARKIVVPQPWQVYNAFDTFYRDRSVEQFKQLGVVMFRCHYVLCDECLYVTLPQHFLSDELAFRKAYSNFYENFNPSNYIIHG